jgi:FMN phosphatase YigB (HAD superfamily)
MSPSLLITDLDNTLYDWVTFFAKAFSAMVDELERVLAIDRETLLSDFKKVHQRYGTSEQPFAALELESVRAKYPGFSRSRLKEKLDPALHVFNSVRKRSLMLYEGVEATLRALHGEGVLIVGHTEAIAVNAYFRLRLLEIDKYFHHLYSIEGQTKPHPAIGREEELAPPPGYLTVLPANEKKPNPRLLLDICAREGMLPEDAVYVGDSLTRDIAMAKAAGVVSVWAKYGTRYDKNLWNVLVRVTHWTDADVARENELRLRADKVVPDYTIEKFAELSNVMCGRGVHPHAKAGVL